MWPKLQALSSDRILLQPRLGLFTLAQGCLYTLAYGFLYSLAQSASNTLNLLQECE